MRKSLLEPNIVMAIEGLALYAKSLSISVNEIEITRDQYHDLLKRLSPKIGRDVTLSWRTPYQEQEIRICVR